MTRMARHLPMTLANERDTVNSLRWVLRELRVLYFAAMTLPIVLGAAVAWARGTPFNVGLFALTVVGGIFMQAGTNMTNDFFDYRADEGDPAPPPLPPEQALQGAVAFLIVGTLIGLYLAMLTGPVVLLLGIVGLVSGYSYSAPPLRLSGTGVGELLAGLNMGVLTTLGSYYVQTLRLTWEPALAAAPVGLLMAALLALHGFQSEKLSQTVGRSLWANLGPQRAAAAYGVPALAAFLLLLAAVLRGALPVTALLALLAVPLAVLAAATAARGHLTGAMRSAMAAHLSTTALLTLAYLIAGTLAA